MKTKRPKPEVSESPASATLDPVGREFCRIMIERIPAASAAPDKISSPEDVGRFWASEIVPMGICRDTGMEVLAAIFVGRKLEPLAWRLLGSGRYSVSFDQQPVLQAACLLGAHGVFLVHNHPSGSMSPSTDDLNMVAEMEMRLRMIGVLLLDSVIVTSDGSKAVGCGPPTKVVIPTSVPAAPPAMAHLEACGRFHASGPRLAVVPDETPPRAGGGRQSTPIKTRARVAVPVAVADDFEFLFECGAFDEDWFAKSIVQLLRTDDGRKTALVASRWTMKVPRLGFARPPRDHAESLRAMMASGCAVREVELPLTAAAEADLARVADCSGVRSDEWLRAIVGVNAVYGGRRRESEARRARRAKVSQWRGYVASLEAAPECVIPFPSR